ncbi:helix-turn-helix transcriptional regulator [Streptantibioticus rubrisoli]|uniref:YafY family transcriptional regulator n=1 Tax=Streptantibioticus rubrisoli TaxID=1387313 RepID=A0ABT1PLG5_9ACTN|nr:YafY family protein [Streptantibioticus rubrisoli]MCQ4046190.1 YafY family transcriptional regulator [Streptantibioticus rubrisoli]
MNRTDRLYALVEELRAASPRPRSARWLAERFEVSTRTIERDLNALQQSGVPLYAEQGRSGGYVLDRERTLPPLNITPAQATALAVGLHTLAGTPFEDDARDALRKVLAVMPQRERMAAGEFADRVRLLVPSAPPPDVPRVLRQALSARRVLRLVYADARGATTERLVEPLGFLGGERWYLVGWCRLRDAVRGFRLDRVQDAQQLDETAPPRLVDLAELDTLGREKTRLSEVTG